MRGLSFFSNGKRLNAPAHCGLALPSAKTVRPDLQADLIKDVEEMIAKLKTA
jgi:hypothetical protein